jgi:hypothetical protein
MLPLLLEKLAILCHGIKGMKKVIPWYYEKLEQYDSHGLV